VPHPGQLGLIVAIAVGEKVEVSERAQSIVPSLEQSMTVFIGRSPSTAACCRRRSGSAGNANSRPDPAHLMRRLLKDQSCGPAVCSGDPRHSRSSRRTSNVRNIAARRSARISE
jgi:hypothetical protein